MNVKPGDIVLLQNSRGKWHGRVIHADEYVIIYIDMDLNKNTRRENEELSAIPEMVKKVLSPEEREAFLKEYLPTSLLE